MTINDIMEKEKYSCFKLVGADYDKSNDVTTITFLYPVNENKPSDELKQELKTAVLNLLDNVSNCKIKFKQSYIDNDILYKKLTDFEQQQFPYLKDFASKDDINCEMKDNRVNIVIKCDNEMAELLKNYNFAQSFAQFLGDSLYEDIEINYNICKECKREEVQEDVSSATELLNIIEEESNLNVVKVDEVVNIVGKAILGDAKFIKDIKKDTECVIAGKFTEPIFTQFVPKSQKDKENPEMKNKFIFTLVDASGKIEVIMFPTDKDNEKLQRLTEGCEVAVSGSMSEFANKTNFKANALSLCKVITKEVKYLWRQPIKDYRIVNPKPMVDLQQMDLFSAFDNTPKDYWADGKSVVVFDFETTGLNADMCEIIEIGAVKVTNGVCVETFSTLVNPKQKLEQEITDLTGITDDMLVFAPTIEEVLPDFHKFVQNCVLSAYNIGFDIKFLKNAGLKYRYQFDNEQIDTLELARKKVASLHNYKLSSVVKALDIVLEDAHRAINDAIATAKVFIKLI